ncbi:MAG: ECF RNA polymerase sigma factor SigW [Herpetosiphonaceae bacterium]|nr:MAG: ECF RNA polymerase sigma factor SigW [Herpetosiphonaceae bacterium]
MERSAEHQASQPELIGRARRGDEAAWETLVREHQEAVFRLAYLMLGDTDEAEDIAQETFIRAFKALDSFAANRPLRPWLLRIASNLARNQRRSASRYLAALRRVVRLSPEQVAPSVDQSTLHSEAQTVVAAVRRLSPSDQEVIYLRYFLELPEAEMAQALGVAPGTIKSRLHRALARLRALVDIEFPDLREGRQS